MIIGVDAGCLGIQDKRLQVGVYKVAIGMLEELTKLDKDNVYLLYSFYPIQKELLHIFGSNMKNVIVAPVRGWNKLWLPLQLLKDKPDVFLALSQAMPQKIPSFGHKTIGIVYDIAFERYPSCYPDSFTLLQRNTRYLTKHADMLIAVSKSTKDDLVRFYQIDAKKIQVSYPGVATVYKPTTSSKVTEKYFLSVGSLKPTKNISTIILAFSRFIYKTKKEYTLYIVGGDKWYDKKIALVLEEIPESIRKKIKFLGFIGNKELIRLYQHASGFIMPSLYEGFGLPAIEAMASGCPIIASNQGSLPEIIGDAGILVQPTLHQDIAKAMEELSSDSDFRSTLRKKGIIRSRQFSNEHFANDVLHAILSCATRQ